MKYIVTAPEKKEYNFKGEFIGINEKRALFYHKDIGKHRVYRDSISKPQHGMKLFIFRSIQAAILLAGRINKANNNTDFSVENYSD